MEEITVPVQKRDLLTLFNEASLVPGIILSGIATHTDELHCLVYIAYEKPMCLYTLGFCFGSNYIGKRHYGKS